MKRGLDLVTEFHKGFGIDMNDVPSLIGKEESEMRYKLMEEENNEYLEACEKEDLIEIADALGDKLYILLGTIISHGLQDVIEDVFLEIHKSNMSKFDENGNPIINGANGVLDKSKPIGKILKPKTFVKPDIDAVLHRFFQEKLKEKFLDDEMKELLDKKYEERDNILREIIKDNLNKTEFKKFEKYEELSDYFRHKVSLIQERSSFDMTRFGVKIGDNTFWVTEKEKSEY